MKILYFLVTVWALFWLGLLTCLGAVWIFIMGALGASEDALQIVGRTWSRSLVFLVGCKLTVRGSENLEPGASYIFASNHTSALDILALFVALPDNLRWIAKKELFEIPVFGYTIRRVGYIPIDRSDSKAALKSLGRAVTRIKDGASVVIFPEGTRTTDGALLPFKPGGLAMAIRARRPVVPVAIAGASKALAPKSMLLKPGPIQVSIGKPIETTGYKMRQRDELAALVRQEVAALLEDKG